MYPKITLWTSLAALPWTFKMFWAPLIELNSTRRRWTISMQILLAIMIGISALAMPGHAYFGLTVGDVYHRDARRSFHDIALRRGLYLMSLDRRRQAAFSGVLGTSSRLARLFITSGIVFFAGWLEHRGMKLQYAWAIGIGAIAIAYALGMVWNSVALPRPAGRANRLSDVAAGETRRNVIRTLTIVAFGVAMYYLVKGTLSVVGNAIAQHVQPGKVPATWISTDSQLHWTYLIIGAAIVMLPVLWVLIAKQVRGTVMGDAFASYIRQPGFGAILAFIIFYRFGESMIFSMNKLFFLARARDKGGNSACRRRAAAHRQGHR